MDDGLNITFIDSHTECDCAAENPGSVLNEFFLNIGSDIVLFTRVVGGRFKSILVQKLGNAITCGSLGSEQKNRGQLFETGCSKEL